MEAPPPGTVIDETVWQVLLAIEERAKQWIIPDKPFDHSYGRLPGETEIRAWSIPRSSGFFLHSLVRVLRPACILEIGASFAYSTLWLASGAPETSTVDTVEILPEKAELARSHISAAGRTNIRLHEKDAHDVTHSWRRPLDFLFLDADPESYIAYFENLSLSFTERAVVVMDNALNHRLETAAFTEHLARQPGWRSWIHPQDNGLLIGIRCADA